MKIIYSKSNGRIITVIEDYMDYKQMFSKFENDFVEDLDELLSDDFSSNNITRYKVVNGELIEYTDLELEEIVKYTRILNDDERLLLQLKPSHKEIQNAENSIEILTLLQGVI